MKHDSRFGIFLICAKSNSVLFVCSLQTVEAAFLIQREKGFAMPVEAIGSFSFVQLDGVPIDASQNPIIRFESRFGKNDVVIFKEAIKRGVPYHISAFRDVSTVAAAKALVKTYQAAKGSTVNLTFANDNEEHQATILDVRPTNLQAIVNAFGGLETNPQAKLQVAFTLIGRDIDRS